MDVFEAPTFDLVLPLSTTGFFAHRGHRNEERSPGIPAGQVECFRLVSVEFVSGGFRHACCELGQRLGAISLRVGYAAVVLAPSLLRPTLALPGRYDPGEHLDIRARFRDVPTESTRRRLARGHQKGPNKGIVCGGYTPPPPAPGTLITLT